MKLTRKDCTVEITEPLPAGLSWEDLREATMAGAICDWEFTLPDVLLRLKGIRYEVHASPRGQVMTLTITRGSTDQTGQA